MKLINGTRPSEILSLAEAIMSALKPSTLAFDEYFEVNRLGFNEMVGAIGFESD